MELNTYTYKGKDFYLLDELKEYDPKFFYGCAQKGPEKIVEKKNILDFEVVKYTKKEDGDYDWSESTFNYKRSKLLVGLRWAVENIPKLCGKKDGYTYEDAPPLLKLSDEECFKDKNGHKLDVEVRGERSEDKVVFKAKDIARIFEMDMLPKTINDKRGNYIKSEDYHIYCIRTDGDSNGLCTNGNKPYTFLTYNGLLKVVFESRSGIAKNFRSWATKVIYTAHLGTTHQREEMSRTILKADSKCIKTVLSKSVCGTPCIYLFSLGKVKDLKKIDYFKEVLQSVSGGTVYKWGRTIDLKRRTGEHQLSFGSMEGVTLVLEIYAYIDPANVVNAESDIKNYFNSEVYNCPISLENFKELVILNKTEFLTTKEKYNELQNQYSGCLKDLVDKNNLQSQEIKELKYELTIKNKDIELLEKDVQLEKERLKSSLLEKEVEILNLKLQLTSISTNPSCV
ncbi:hypothetical protein WIV_gp166 [Wiseana iridescent virus]|uniref:Bro-N domain-containing protein n=1 Tax=Wiseana iridescent virus TaxID=68347 RepID=G0T5J2_IRV9|nr:hypothetical protein WIV_gp166 [Wiseana iridescent virus]ADO00510.1 hypothetical protein [Wiseana iridescent virus]